MRAVRYDGYGSADVLYVADIAELEPGPGAVKLHVRAASLNPLDCKARAGHLRWVPIFRGPPRGTGCDVAGEIVAIGSGTASRHMGERVFGLISPMARDGAFAEYAVVPAESLAAIPDGVDFEQAATLPLAGGMALQALVDHACLGAGERVLITGAAGGVGHFAVQIANIWCACCRRVQRRNVEFVRGLGATKSSTTAGTISRDARIASTSSSTRRAHRRSPRRDACSPRPAAISTRRAVLARRSIR